MTAIFEETILGNQVHVWLAALGIFLGVAAAIHLFKHFLLQRWKRLAARTGTQIDDYFAENFSGQVAPVIYVAAFWLALHRLTFPLRTMALLEGALTVAATFFVVRFVAGFITDVLRNRWIRHDDTGARKQSLAGLIAVIKAAVWLLGIIFVIDNFGFKISALVAGLGIGGIAVALAAQTILGDLFSYVSIFFDRPFEVGHFIQVGDLLGEVEYIGLKTTRLRSLSGEQIVISNSDLTNSRVRNYRRMVERRVVFRFGVEYGTDYESLQEIPQLVRDIVTGLDKTRFDRAHFAAFGEFSLDFEVVYYALTSSYNEYMDVQQTINLSLYAELEKRDVSFALPVRKVHLESPM